MKPKLKKTLYIIALLILVGTLLFVAADQKSFWEDEAFTADFAQQSPGDLLKGVAWDVHPPLFMFLIGQWGRQFGFNELGLRSFSILWALIALLLTYKLALDLLGERTALVAITLMGLTPLMVLYGHNARYYSLAMVLALFAAWSTLRFFRPNHVVYLLIYIVSGTAFLYLLFAAASALLACNFWWLARWIRQKKDRSYAGLVLWLLSQGLIVVLYLPGLPFLQSVTGRFSKLVEVSNWFVEIAKRAGYYGFVSAVGETLSPLNPLAWLGILVLVGAAVYAVVKNYRSLKFWLPVSFFLVIAGVNLLVTFNVAVSATWQNLTYRALYAYPFLMIWLGAGFASMKPRWAVISAAAIALVFVFGIFNYFTNRQFIRPVFTVPWSAIFERIQTEAKPGALVMCGFGDFSCDYYANRYGLGQNNLNNWTNLKNDEYPEVWYIQTNLSREDLYGDQPNQQAQFFDEMARRYPMNSAYNYAGQDASIRWLKAKFLNQDYFDYRVNVRKFFGP
jgi:uncharacterized membrane protein